MSGDILLTQLVGNLFGIVVGILVLDVLTNLYGYDEDIGQQKLGYLVHQGEYKLVVVRIKLKYRLNIIGKKGYFEF